MEEKKNSFSCISNLSSGDFPASHLSLPRKKLPTVQETRYSCSSSDVLSPIPLWIQSPSVSVAGNRTPKPPGKTKRLSHMIPNMSLKTGNPPLDLRKQNEGMKLKKYYVLYINCCWPKKNLQNPGSPHHLSLTGFFIYQDSRTVRCVAPYHPLLLR